MIYLIHGTLNVSRHTYVLREHQKRRDCFCLNTFCFGCSSFVFLLLRRYDREMIKGQYRNFIILHNDSCCQSQAAMFVWSRRLLALTWPGFAVAVHPRRCWMRWSSGFWFCADQMSSLTPNWETEFFMDLALRTGALSCWSRKETNTNCRHNAGRSHCVL